MIDEALQRLRWLEERRKLAAAIGVEIPKQPLQNPGETDKEYGIRLAQIAKSFCGPPPRKRVAPKRLPKITPTNDQQTADVPPTSDDGDRLGGMTPDFTTPEEL
jgi:hypothetical protein